MVSGKRCLVDFDGNPPTLTAYGVIATSNLGANTLSVFHDLKFKKSNTPKDLYARAIKSFARLTLQPRKTGRILDYVIHTD